MLRMAYLALAVWGAANPASQIIGWVAEAGFSLPDLLEAWNANAATRVLRWDLVIAATALVVWAIAETRVRKNWFALWALPATFLIGVGCGLPLYLFLRTRPVT